MSGDTSQALLISDLHLSASRPEIIRQFKAFLSGPARTAEALYILGDLFDYWAGDDDLDDPFSADIVQALARFGKERALFFMHGNRDFLVGPAFAQAANLRLIEDPTPVSIGGRRTLLMHGDTLCTDDVDYVRFREEIRSPDWAARFLGLPLAERKRHIESLRVQSERQKQHKSMEIMDVSQPAVMAAMRAYDCDRIIHGHTHRPARHQLLVDGRACERLVLAAWHEQGSFLRCTATSCEAADLDVLADPRGTG